MARASKEGEIHPEARSVEIVDSDFHINVEEGDLLPYIDDPEIKETVEKYGFPIGDFNSWVGTYAGDVDTLGDTQGTAKDREAVLRVKDRLGADHVIGTPGSTVFLLETARYPKIKTELLTAYNDYIAENLIDPAEQVYATLSLPRWEPEAAVRELERHGEDPGFVAGQAWFSFSKPLGARKFDPIYEKLVEMDLPLVLHGSGGFWHRFDELGENMRTYFEVVSLTWPIHAMMYATNMISRGVFDVYPELDIVIQETGISWVPFLANRLDEMYTDHPEDTKFVERKYEEGERYLDRMPSEYLYDNFSFTTQPISLPDNPAHARAMLEMLDAKNNVMFSTDWPHHTFDTPNWIFENPEIDADLREQILHSNAKTVFDLD
jgi:predicted TIM-barrel fold metal-dependent hydrolase